MNRQRRARTGARSVLKSTTSTPRVVSVNVAVTGADLPTVTVLVPVSVALVLVEPAMNVPEIVALLRDTAGVAPSCTVPCCVPASVA